MRLQHSEVIRSVSCNNIATSHCPYATITVSFHYNVLQTRCYYMHVHVLPHAQLSLTSIIRDSSPVTHRSGNNYLITPISEHTGYKLQGGDSFIL